ncbi:c-type cytochrome biogenesis protein CcmI [Hwanghaeella grinnelliae]|uniref:C-type cytochrome biogenesis protein CcmI n=1 Tax=Hwanghaeella grinnelliae TaxID=2500179 RepID=A0A3S2W4U4_9PROT|nr:c-type cytochrome biogenesis protein CcmI [Hwanghaeella grinnelliae]RVU36514.1 c-type cytochrome biogenesis protein CcmI [Hwanghaeella grinnelliae]
MFWIFAALITALVVALIAWPFFRQRQKAQTTADFDVEVYKSQLRELDRELAEGLVNDQEAAAAKAEVARRLLAADTKRAVGARMGWGVGLHRMTGVVVSVAVPAAAVMLYLTLGQPTASDVPYASRADEIARMQQAQERDLGNLGAMAERLAERLEKEPGDADGWLLLGRTYMTMQDFGKAAETFRKVVELSPDDPGAFGALGEALVLAAEGMVTKDAVAAFEKAQEIGAEGDPRASFYLAEAEYQSGNHQAALDALVKLAWSAEPGAPWLVTVRNRAISIADELGQDGASLLPNAPAPPAVAATDQSGPTAEDIAAADQMADADRQAMIRGMVDGLAAKLEDNPMDFQGWTRLIRARTVMGDMEQAQAELDKALEIFDRAPVPKAELRRLAGELGLTAPGAEGAVSETETAPGPSAADVAAAQEMSDEDRQAMIEGMVGGLAARLEENPNDLEGWMRLARSYNVLDRPQDALAALEKAGEAFPEETSVMLLRGRLIRSMTGVPTTEESQALMDNVLAVDPNNVEALWFKAIGALEKGDRDTAAEHFDKAVSALPEGSQDRAALERQRDELLSVE